MNNYYSIMHTYMNVHVHVHACIMYVLYQPLLFTCGHTRATLTTYMYNMYSTCLLALLPFIHACNLVGILDFYSAYSQVSLFHVHERKLLAQCICMYLTYIRVTEFR